MLLDISSNSFGVKSHKHFNSGLTDCKIFKAASHCSRRKLYSEPANECGTFEFVMTILQFPKFNGT